MERAAEDGREQAELLKPKGADGFSLLEVLVATALLGLVMVVVLQVLSSNLRAQEASWNQAWALQTAEKLLQAHCRGGTLASTSGREGAYNFLVQVTPQYSISSPNGQDSLACYSIRVTVTWQERGRLKSLSLETARAEVGKNTKG